MAKPFQLTIWMPKATRRHRCPNQLEEKIMKKFAFISTFLVFFWGGLASALAEETTCFESRKGASELTPRMLTEDLPSVKCSPKTGAVLWWGDPFDGTVPMGQMPIEDADYARGTAVVKPRSDKLGMLPLCGQTCHEGTVPEGEPKGNYPREIKSHKNIVLNGKDLPHGRGSVWCLDCHNRTERNKLIDNFGNPISYDQPQLLCGKCHGDIFRDWRDGIHGKRIGEWASTGKKRWFVCTECHNPHNVQQGSRNSGFAQHEPEWAPVLPKGMKTPDHERKHPAAGEHGEVPQQ